MKWLLIATIVLTVHTMEYNEKLAADCARLPCGCDSCCEYYEETGRILHTDADDF